MNLLEETRQLIKDCVRELKLPEAAYEYLKELSKMMEAFEIVYEFSKNNKISMRKAAYMVAIKRIAEVMMIRGWI